MPSATVPDIPDPALLPAGLRPEAGDVVEAVEISDDDDGRAAQVGAPGAGEGEAEGEAEVRTSGFDGVGTRREARERALALLYEAEQKGLAPLAKVLADLPVAPEPFAAELVQGVSGHQSELDEALSTYSHNWPLARMPAIDRALLRIGAYELAHTDVPVGACISEAVELAKRYSTDDSHAFVNGLLARLAETFR